MRNPSSERLRTIIKYLGETQSSFAEKIGTSQSTIATAISRGSDLGGILLGKILIAFPKISISWLLTGEGSMIKDEEPDDLTMRGRIKLAKSKLGISYEDAAAMMQMPLKDIKRYTNGESSPNIGFVKKFAKAYPSINMVWLLTGEGEMLNDNLKQEEEIAYNPNLTALIKVGEKYYSANTLDELKNIISQIEKTK